MLPRSNYVLSLILVSRRYLHERQAVAPGDRQIRVGGREQDPHRQQVGLDGQACGHGGAGARARERARHQVHGDLSKDQRGRRRGFLHARKVRPVAMRSRARAPPPPCVGGGLTRSRRDIKARLIDSQPEAAGAASGAAGTDGAVKVNQPANQTGGGCC